MDNSTSLIVALIVIVVIFFGIIITFLTCWYIRRLRQKALTRNFSPSDDTPLLPRLNETRIERTQAQERSALLTCHFYIRTVGDYIFDSQLSQLGSNPEKSWFSVSSKSKRSAIQINNASYILTIQSKSDRLQYLNDEESAAEYSRILNNLLSRLYHPYVEPVIRVDILSTQKSVVTIKQYQRLGSLKDILHGAVPTANFHV